jgi:hypothetical protein
MPDDTPPPSFSDCVLKQFYRPEIEEIAECFYYGVQDRLQDEPDNNIDHWADIDPLEEPCHEMARAIGLDFLGSGISRATFRVKPDDEPSDEEPDGPTKYDACIFKFARYSPNDGRNEDGKHQMSEEIQSYEALPSELVSAVDGQTPPFNPVRDYDSTDALWMTTPYCPSPGNIRGVSERIKMAGWKAYDLSSDNVGEYPFNGESAVIDYGLEVEDRSVDLDTPMNKFDDGLRSLGVHSISRAPFSTAGAEVNFEIPMDDDMRGDYPANESTATFTEKGTITNMDVYFPKFEATRLTQTNMKTVMREMAVSPSGFGSVTNNYAKTGGNTIYANVRIDYGRAADQPPNGAIGDLRELVTAYEDEINGYLGGGTNTRNEPITEGVRDIDYAEDFIDPEVQWRNALEELGMRNVAFPGGNEPNVVFDCPLSMEPEPSPTESTMWWWNGNPADVQTVHFNAGEISTTMSEQPDMRALAKDVAAEADENVGGGTDITAQIAHRTDDPTTDAQLWDVRYTIEYEGNDFIDPWYIKMALKSLKVQHNRNFTPSG